jgi:hypothetical protein
MSSFFSTVKKLPLCKLGKNITFLSPVIFFLIVFLFSGSWVTAQHWHAQYEAPSRFLQAHFPLNEGEGTNARDHVSRKALTISGAAWAPGCEPGKPFALSKEQKTKLADEKGDSREDFSVLLRARVEGGAGYLLLKKGVLGFPNIQANGNINAYLASSGDGSLSIPLGKLNDSDFHCWVLTVKNQKATFYMDGRQVADRALKAPLAKNKNPFLLGHSEGWGAETIVGEASLFRVYNHCLDAEKVLQITEKLSSGQDDADYREIDLQLPLTAKKQFVSDDRSYEERPHSLFFDGENSYATLPDYPALREPSGLTVGAWIKPDHIMPKKLEEQGYIAEQGSGRDSGWRINTYYDGGLAAAIITDKGVYNASAAAVLREGAWQHVAFTWNGKILRLYVNGAAVGPATLTEGKLKSHPGRITLGKAADRLGQHYKGCIDEVKIFSAGLGGTMPENIGAEVSVQAKDDPSEIKLDAIRHMKGAAAKIKPLVDFEDLSGWSLTTYEGVVEAELLRSNEDPLWDNYTARVNFQAGEFHDPEKKMIIVRPPNPIMIPNDFDSIQFWVSANFWGRSAGAQIDIEFEDAEGELHCKTLKSAEQPFIFWSGWSTADLHLGKAFKKNARFLGFYIRDFEGNRPTTMFFDNLAFYKRSESMPPGMEVPSWSDIGAPTSPDGMLPALEGANRCLITVRQEADAYYFTSNDGADSITWIYSPKTGQLHDLQAVFKGKRFQPCQDGGFVFVGDGQPAARLIEAKLEGGSVHTRWSWHRAGQELTRTEMKLTAKQKSMQIELNSSEGVIEKVSFGRAAGLDNPILQAVPYFVMRGKGSEDPAVLYDGGMLFSAFVDIYSSEASALTGGLRALEGDTAKINGGSLYLPLTNGRRNPVGEKLFLNLSSKFAEVLPTIANPPNPTMPITKNGLWVSKMWYDVMPYPKYFEEAYSSLERLHGYGLRNLMVRDHGSLYRQYSPKRRGESMSLVTDIEPAIGGDEAARTYFAKAQNDLGYRMGLYTNFTLISPLMPDEFDVDKVTQDSDGNWRYGSGGCKMYKHTYMLEAQRRINPILKEKFDLKCSYPDQYTCRAPWAFTDYDARVPEAGKFSPALRVLAACLILEREVFEVPLSEGIMQWPLAGYCDSYAQPGSPGEAYFPEFQLRRIHNLSNDTGTHLSNFFFSNSKPELLDRFLSGQIVNGVIGHLFDFGIGKPSKKITFPTFKSYYIMKQLQLFYAGIKIEEILYYHNGQLLNAAEAIAAGATESNQVYLKYANGLEAWVNGNSGKEWLINCAGEAKRLPVYGYCAMLKDQVMTYSAMQDERRVDYSFGPEYLFFNGNGVKTTFPGANAINAYAVNWEDDCVNVIPLPFVSEETIEVDLAFLPFAPGETIELIDGQGKVVGSEALKTQTGKIMLPIRKNIMRYRAKKQ